MSTERLERVLLVEDDADIQMLARLALADLGGLEVEVCGSGREALSKLESFAPQLILLDVMMPELDGPSTLAELRRRRTSAEIPVVFMTAKAQTDEIAGYQHLGAAGVIVKPFDPLLLPETVREHWRRWHER